MKGIMFIKKHIYRHKHVYMECMSIFVCKKSKHIYKDIHFYYKLRVLEYAKDFSFSHDINEQFCYKMGWNIISA